MTKAYTVEQVKFIKATYKRDDSDEDRNTAVTLIAKKFGKSRQSVISKLSREGLYVSPQRVTKSGAPVVNKEAYMQHIRIMLGASAAQELNSLEKVTKADLKTISELLNRLNDKDEAAK